MNLEKNLIINLLATFLGMIPILLLYSVILKVPVIQKYPWAFILFSWDLSVLLNVRVYLKRWDQEFGMRHWIS